MSEDKIYGVYLVKSSSLLAAKSCWVESYYGNKLTFTHAAKLIEVMRAENKDAIYLIKRHEENCINESWRCCCDGIGEINKNEIEELIAALEI